MITWVGWEYREWELCAYNDSSIINKFWQTHRNETRYVDWLVLKEKKC